MTRAALLIFTACAALAAAGSAATRFHALSIGAYPPNSRVTITTPEFNAWLRTEVPLVIGPGIRNPHVEGQDGNLVYGTADIDFLRLRQASNAEKPNWLLQQLLSGERPVTITARLTTSHGKARVDVVRVSISGVVAEGRTLDLLISNFLLPTFPDAKIGKDFPLDYNMDHFEISPAGVTVVLNGQRFRPKP